MTAANHLRIPQLKPNQVWQGKQDLNISVPELGTSLKKVTIRSAVSIWEDVDDDERAVPTHPVDLVKSRPVNSLDPYEGDSFLFSSESGRWVIDFTNSMNRLEQRVPCMSGM